MRRKIDVPGMPLVGGAVRKRVTIRDVARDAEVSTSTVSRYLNHSGNVDQQTAGRIALAMERLRYVPSIAAQSLRMRASRIVLLVVPDICNPFYSLMAKTVQKLLGDRGYVIPTRVWKNGSPSGLLAKCMPVESCLAPLT